MHTADEFMTPSQIQVLRLSYGLSQKDFATLLGWSEQRVIRYEKGDSLLPEDAALLSKLSNPKKMLEYVFQSALTFS